jgi:hypothetical protein
MSNAYRSETGRVGNSSPKFCKFKKILADLSENRLNSGNFITMPPP